jgi:hypothetical protein
LTEIFFIIFINKMNNSNNRDRSRDQRFNSSFVGENHNQIIQSRQ